MLFTAQALEAEKSPFMVPMMSLRHVLEAVAAKDIDLGCIPVENALEGSVGEVLDLLAFKTNQTQVVAEFVKPITHALIRQYEYLEGIAFIHSHPQAIGQCKDALISALGPDIRFIPAASTSEAVRGLLDKDPAHAAIGSIYAAQHYNLPVVMPNIGGLDHNATRFWVASTHTVSPSQSLPYTLKTSLCLGLDENKPGALLSILTTLAQHHLNMTKIESRPTKQCLGAYLFFLDIDGVLSPDIQSELKQQCSFFKLLGMYPSYGTLSY